MEKIWLKQYPTGVPEDITIDDNANLIDFFESISHQFADKTAFRNFGHSMSYAKLDADSQALAAYLQQQNLQKGDRVAIMMPNLLQYPVALFAILRAGMVAVNVNPLYTAPEVASQLNDAQASAIIVLSNFASTVAAVAEKTTLKHMIVTDLGDMLPSLKRITINFIAKYIKKMVPAFKLPQAIHWRDMLARGQQLHYKRPDISGDDIAFLQYTGGTTGKSKGTMLTHRNIIANTEQAYVWFKQLIAGKEAIVAVAALPLYHIFALVANLFLFMRFGQTNLLVTNPRDIHGFIKLLKQEKFSVIIGVNTLFNALINHKDFAKLDFSRLLIGLGGGMAVQESIAEKWKNIVGKLLMEGYGLTEASPIVAVMPFNQTEFDGSIGLPLPSTEIKIIDDDGKELPQGETGELCVRGPQVMKGYWQQAEETKMVLSEDGWLKTGDMARVDDIGRVYLVDRKKDMILVSGFNVYPNEIEDILVSHPGIKEAAVIGVAAKSRGEAVKAFIVKQEESLTEENVRTYCREHLTAYKRPKFIEFRDELPKNNVGKILRRALR
ncbi:MAG: AMP-binding protein [Pseudomonadota bacterium]